MRGKKRRVSPHEGAGRRRLGDHVTSAQRYGGDMAAARFRLALVCLILVAACAAAATHPAFAQESRGSISGTVRDNSGGALPGVTVTATQKDTNRATTAVTNEAGSYNLLFLQPGIYSVTAELSGFKKTLRDNVEVRVNDRMGIDLTMEIGGLEETVTVTAESPLLETRSGSQGARSRSPSSASLRTTTGLSCRERTAVAPAASWMRASALVPSRRASQVSARIG
jgi:hypothetical protein